MWFTIGIKIIQQTCGAAIGDKFKMLKEQRTGEQMKTKQTLVLALTTYRRWFEFGCNKSHTIHVNVKATVQTCSESEVKCQCYFHVCDGIR